MVWYKVVAVFRSSGNGTCAITRAWTGKLRLPYCERMRLSYARPVVAHVSLFGSVARGGNHPASDVDVAVKLTEAGAGGGFAYFGRIDALRRLTDILGCPVNVVVEPGH